MTEKTADFMLEEYKQIANAYQDLHAQHNELVKNYLTLVALPASILAVLVKLLDSTPQSSTTVPQNQISQSAISAFIVDVSQPVILMLLVILFLVGCCILAALVTTRAEAIWYVRTVNCVRRYFVEHDSERRLGRYLSLPDYDTFPQFWEGCGARSFWNVMMVAILNCGIIWVMFYVMLFQHRNTLILICTIAAVIVGLVQLCIYRRLMCKRERSYSVHFRGPLPDYIIGIDLDGVIGDLASELILVAKDRFNIKISKSDIKEHNVAQCTPLTGDQVKEIFSSSDIFKTMSPMQGASEFLSRLRTEGWIVHIVTDRFWNDDNWITTRQWLDSNNLRYDYLNLVQSSTKSHYAEVHRFIVFVEDRLDTAIDLANKCQYVFLVDAPYNQGQLPENVIRVESLSSITKELDQLPLVTSD